MQNNTTTEGPSSYQPWAPTTNCWRTSWMNFVGPSLFPRTVCGKSLNDTDALPAMLWALKVIDSSIWHATMNEYQRAYFDIFSNIFPTLQDMRMGIWLLMLVRQGDYHFTLFASTSVVNNKESLYLTSKPDELKNEMSNFVYMNFCAEISYYIDFRQDRYFAKNLW